MPEIVEGHEDWGLHYEPREVAALVYGAGWTHVWNLLRMTSIVIAESNGYARRVNVNYKLDADGNKVLGPDGEPIALSTDRGMFMLNDRAHPDVSDEVAFDPERAVVEARRIYLRAGGGKRGFRVWAAWTNGQWRGPRALGYAFNAVANMLREMEGWPLPK